MNETGGSMSEKALGPLLVVCPVCSGSALVGLSGKTDNGSDGPCVMHAGHSYVCWGEGDVASDWSPATSCPTCCTCVCGTFLEKDEVCRFCGDPQVGTPGYLKAKWRS